MSISSADLKSQMPPSELEAAEHRPRFAQQRHFAARVESMRLWAEEIAAEAEVDRLKGDGETAARLLALAQAIRQEMIAEIEEELCRLKET